MKENDYKDTYLYNSKIYKEIDLCINYMMCVLRCYTIKCNKKKRVFIFIMKTAKIRKNTNPFFYLKLDPKTHLQKLWTHECRHRQQMIKS